MVPLKYKYKKNIQKKMYFQIIYPLDPVPVSPKCFWANYFLLSYEEPLFNELCQVFFWLNFLDQTQLKGILVKDKKSVV